MKKLVTALSVLLLAFAAQAFTYSKDMMPGTAIMMDKTDTDAAIAASAATRTTPAAATALAQAVLAETATNVATSVAASTATNVASATVTNISSVVSTNVATSVATSVGTSAGTTAGSIAATNIINDLVYTIATNAAVAVNADTNQVTAAGNTSTTNTPFAGQIYFDEVSSNFFGYTGAAWVQLDN